MTYSKKCRGEFFSFLRIFWIVSVGCVWDTSTFTSEINGALNGVIVACASARWSMKRQHHEGDTCVPAWVHRCRMQRHGADKIKSRACTWLTGRLRHRETREIKARAHNKVPRVQGSWRTNVEPSCARRVHVCSCFTKRGTIFLHIISTYYFPRTMHVITLLRFPFHTALQTMFIQAKDAEWWIVRML